nr:hypothetical protein Iba_scaffold1541428CG0010 [Ipomoea batatas]
MIPFQVTTIFCILFLLVTILRVREWPNPCAYTKPGKEKTEFDIGTSGFYKLVVVVMEDLKLTG